MKIKLPVAVLVGVLIAAFIFSGVNTYLLFDKNRTLQEQIKQTNNQLNQTAQQLEQTRDQLNQKSEQLSQQLNQTGQQLSEQINQTSQQQSQNTQQLNQQLNQTLQEQLTAQASNLTGDIDVLNQTSHLPVEEYDYIIFQMNGLVEAKNGTNGHVDFSSTNAALVMNQALSAGNNVYIKSGEYSLNSDVLAYNKKNARIDGDNSVVYGNGHGIIIKGDNYTRSQYNSLSGFDLINCTLRIENSFRTTVSNVIFEKSSKALELVNSNTWTEGTTIQDCRFQESEENIVFTTPSINTSNPSNGNVTGSYGSSQINRVFFNLLDNSVAIKVETGAEFSDSQLEDVRIWMGENGQNNQTGLELDGSMYKSLLTGVVFESFATMPLENNNMYAITIGSTAYQSPIIAGGVSFLGSWTARINNPYNIWIYGFGSAFKQEDNNTIIGSQNQYGPAETINTYPATLTSFKTKIGVQGSFNNNETITVRIRLEFVDNTLTAGIEKSFTNSTSTWLSDDDMLQLFPSQNVIWAILIDAKTNSTTTDANVTVGVYGVTT